MKVEEPQPILPARQIGLERAVPPPDSAGGSHDHRRSHPDEREAAPALEDVASVHGVDEDDLTPNVRNAMVELIAEVATLREALDQNRNRLEYLTMLADQDPVSLVLNRRAFVRELSKALMIAQRRGTDSGLLFVRIENLKLVNAHYGLAAGDAAVEHVAGVIQDHTPDGDVVGRIGGAVFGVILIGEQKEQARLRAANLTAAVGERPLVWQGTSVPLTLIAGIYDLNESEDASAAMNAADERLRELKSDPLQN